MVRTVVVSGGGTGMGRAVARSVVAAGGRAVVLGRRADALRTVEGELGPSRAGAAGVVAVPVDLTDPEQVRRVVDDAIGPLGAVDGLVHAAGGLVAPPPGAADATDLAAVSDWWQRTYALNVTSGVMLTEALLPALRRPGGRVVMISSIAAVRGGGGPYGAAKAAVHGWVWELAERLGPDGITVNAVAPGYIADTGFFGDMDADALRRQLVDETLTGRAGRPEDIAAAVDYLLAPSSAQVTAQILHVNGGAVPGR